VNGRKTAVVVRESLMLETRGSSNLVNIVNPVYSLKEYCPPLSVFLDEQHHLCALSPVSSEWGRTAAVVREALMLQTRGSCTLLSMVSCFSI
jgi:hypothetical protein